MQRLLTTLALSAALLAGAAGSMTTLRDSAGAVAGERGVTLAVDNLKGNCPSCAFIVDRTLSRIDGVHRVEVWTRAGTATVVYDDGLVDLAALTEATAAVGFPSRPLEQDR